MKEILQLKMETLFQRNLNLQSLSIITLKVLQKDSIQSALNFSQEYNVQLKMQSKHQKTINYDGGQSFGRVLYHRSESNHSFVLQNQCVSLMTEDMLGYVAQQQQLHPVRVDVNMENLLKLHREIRNLLGVPTVARCTISD